MWQSAKDLEYAIRLSNDELSPAKAQLSNEMLGLLAYAAICHELVTANGGAWTTALHAESKRLMEERHGGMEVYT